MPALVSADIPYIQSFLRRSGMEGPQQRAGYIPARPGNYKGQGDPTRYTAIGSSGVTIATGCDLGQTDATTMLGYGLEAGIVNALRPYFGLKKADAIAKLHTLPLHISQATADAMDHAVHAGYFSRFIEPVYNKASRAPFGSLPKQAQAVIFSLCFNYGCSGFRKRAPNTWAALTRQDWPDAASRLCKSALWDEDWAKARRGIEGRLLKEVC